MYNFEELVEKYWAAVTSEYWTLAEIISKQLRSLGAKFIKGKWVLYS